MPTQVSAAVAADPLTYSDLATDPRAVWLRFDTDPYADCSPWEREFLEAHDPLEPDPFTRACRACDPFDDIDPAFCRQNGAVYVCWLVDATPEQRQALARALAQQLGCAVAAPDPEQPAFDPWEPGDDTPGSIEVLTYRDFVTRGMVDPLDTPYTGPRLGGDELLDAAERRMHHTGSSSVWLATMMADCGHSDRDALDALGRSTSAVTQKACDFIRRGYGCADGPNGRRIPKAVQHRGADRAAHLRKSLAWTLELHSGDEREMLEIARRENAVCDPPLPGSEVRAIVNAVRTGEAESSESLKPRIRTVTQLAAEFPELREPVIDGVCRRGEIVNLIAPPKTGKSWLVNDLALSVATGRDWLDFKTSRGDVLILDNELHSPVSAKRIPAVADARGIPLKDYGEHIGVENLRGRGVLPSINELRVYFSHIRPGQYRLVILDAFYRFLADGMSENDNAAMAQAYNTLDSYAQMLDCAFVVIHHTSKGTQSGKSVTDVGAGAGSQSRAADAHLVLRPHENDGCVILEGVVRSFAPLEPRGLRWTFPVWNVDAKLNPRDLNSPRTATRGIRRSGTAKAVQSFCTRSRNTAS